MTTMNLFFLSLAYVFTQNMFLQSMGMTVAIAMFFGVIIYGGNLENNKKGILAILGYATMIGWMTFIRATATISTFPSHPERIYAGIATIFYITIFWLLGIVGGGIIYKMRSCGIFKKNPFGKLQKCS